MQPLAKPPHALQPGPLCRRHVRIDHVGEPALAGVRNGPLQLRLLPGREYAGIHVKRYRLELRLAQAGPDGIEARLDRLRLAVSDPVQRLQRLHGPLWKHAAHRVQLHPDVPESPAPERCEGAARGGQQCTPAWFHLPILACVPGKQAQQ